MRRNQVFNDEGRGLGVNVSRHTAEATRVNWLYESRLRVIDPGGAGHYAKSARNRIEYGDVPRWLIEITDKAAPARPRNRPKDD